MSSAIASPTTILKRSTSWQRIGNIINKGKITINMPKAPQTRLKCPKIKDLSEKLDNRPFSLLSLKRNTMFTENITLLVKCQENT
jgi:hypothetical protein